MRYRLLSLGSCRVGQAARALTSSPEGGGYLITFGDARIILIEPAFSDCTCSLNHFFFSPDMQEISKTVLIVLTASDSTDKLRVLFFNKSYINLRVNNNSINTITYSKRKMHHSDLNFIIIRIIITGLIYLTH